VISSDVEHLCLLYELPDLRGLQVLDLIVVCGSQFSDHGAVVAGNDNTASSSWCLVIDVVLNTETNFVGCFG
jgi:hypothetical protein